MFEVNNKDTRTTPLANLSIIYDGEFISYFTPCSTVSNVNFEQVNASWEIFIFLLKKIPINRHSPRSLPVSQNMVLFMSKPTDDLRSLRVDKAKNRQKNVLDSSVRTKE